MNIIMQREALREIKNISRTRASTVSTRDYIVFPQNCKTMDQLQEKDFPEETVKQVSNLLYKLRTHVAMATRAYTTVSS